MVTDKLSRIWRLLVHGSGSLDVVPISKVLVRFLEAADDAYILANMNRQVYPFALFATSRLSNELIDIVNNGTPKLFGTKDYRDRTWTLVSTSDSAIQVRKDIRYKNISISRDITLSIGDDIVEYWEIVKIGSGFLVSDILGIN